MADIRINSLPTTAASTASDDFVAVDGSANGTRKLNAFSPTFGGNLTVSGATRVSDGTAAAPSISLSSATTTGFYKYNASALGFSSSGSHSFLFGTDGTIYGANLGSTLSMPAAGGVTLTAGGTNQNVALTPSGTGVVSVTGNLTVSGGTISSGAGNTLLLQQANYGGGLSANASGQVIVAAYNSQPLRLQTQGADVLYLTSGGNALIGTTTDGGQKLQVSGSATFTGVLTVSGTSGNTFNAGTIVTPTITSQVNQAFRIISTSTAEVQQGFLQTGNFGYYIQVGGSSSYPLMLQPAGSNVLIGTTTDNAGKVQVYATGSGIQPALLLSTSGTTTSDGVGLLFTANGYAQKMARIHALLQGNDYADLIFSVGDGADSYAEAFRVSAANRNLLIGTTTDSGNGKLQLATHTTSAGGIGFGTSLSVYSDSANRFCVVGGTTTRFRLFSTSGNAAELGFDNSELYAQSTTQIRFITNNTTALTLDSSQNATFAGKTYTAAGAAATPAISFSGDTDTGFYNAGGNQMALACGGGQIWNTTVNGLSMASGKDIYLGNAYVAGAPTATGYVTIKDSAGNTYKVLVGT